MTHSNSAADGFLPVALIGRGRMVSSPMRASAALSVVDYQPQKIDGTERGARSWGMCRQFPAVADHLQDWPRKRAGMVTSNCCSRTGGGLGRPAFHHFDFRTQPTWQGIADVLEAHSKISVASCGFNKPREAGDEVPENEAFGTHDDC